MLDEDTRIDRMEGAHQEIVYFNTLINYTYDQFPDPQLLFDAITPTIREAYCVGEGMKAIRDAGIALQHFYYDKNGELIGTIKTNLANYE